VKPQGPHGGPTYDNRGASIVSNEKGTSFSLALEGFPHGSRGYWGGIGNTAEIVRLVDAWLDTGKLPPPHVNKGQGSERKSPTAQRLPILSVQPLPCP
jgi:hypothetical protein